MYFCDRCAAESAKLSQFGPWRPRNWARQRGSLDAVLGDV
jgi:hypothetical protein